MSKLTEEQKAKGRKRFLDQNTEVASKIASLTKTEADILGISLENLRIVETMKALAEYARTNRIESDELFLSCERMALYERETKVIYRLLMGSTDETLTIDTLDEGRLAKELGFA